MVLLLFESQFYCLLLFLRYVLCFLYFFLLALLCFLFRKVPRVILAELSGHVNILNKLQICPCQGNRWLQQQDHNADTFLATKSAVYYSPVVQESSIERVCEKN